MGDRTVRIDGEEIDWIRVSEFDDGEYSFNIQVTHKEMSIPVDEEFYDSMRSLVDESTGVGRIERE